MPILNNMIIHNKAFSYKAFYIVRPYTLPDLWVPGQIWPCSTAGYYTLKLYTLK